MGTASLTTKGVARLLHVSEATVKRWADNGLLHSKKTVGGHRRFGIQSVALLRREQGIEPDRQAPRNTGSKKRGLLTSPARFTELLLQGNEQEAAGVIIDSYLHSHALASLFDTTITKAMHQVGELWFSGTVTVADEHLATRVVLSALQKLRDIVVPAAPTGLQAICCGIEGDLHELPVHLAEMILETEGWDARNLGPNTPLFALREMVAHERPQLVCIAARSIADLDRATTEYAQLRKVTERIDARVVLGGEAFRNFSLRRRFPSDFYGEDFAGLSKFVRGKRK